TDPASTQAVRELADHALALPTAARLPLLQVATGALREFDPPTLSRFVAALDELVHADARVTTFEYAMQKLIAHHLQLAEKAASDPTEAGHAFAAGAARLRMLEPPPALLARDAISLDTLDAALDRLTRASLPIKKRLIDAAAHVIAADGTVRETEAELLRAVCAALDCPMPPLV